MADFISVWKTTLPNETITLPLYSGGTYNFYVDWGDGNNNTITAWNDVAKTHNYIVAGNHTVTISGILIGFRFNNGGSKSKIINITQCGILNCGNVSGCFWGCNNLIWTATDALDLTGVTTLENMFYICNIFNGAIGNWNTSTITNMTHIFDSAYAFNQPIGNWDVSTVTNMTYMFRNAYAFNQNIGNWNIINVINAQNMFQNVTLSTIMYDALLVGWSTKIVQNNVIFSGGNNSKYSSIGGGLAGRTHLTGTHNWIITDGGIGPGNLNIQLMESLVISEIPIISGDKCKNLSDLITITDSPILTHSKHDCCFDPREDIRTQISIITDLFQTGEQQYTILIIDASNNHYQIPIYLTEEIKSSNSPLPPLPFIELGLLNVIEIPQDIGAKTRKREARIDVNIYWQKNDDVIQNKFGKLISDKFYDQIRINQCGTIPGQHFMSISGGGRVLIENYARQVVYHKNMEIYVVFYDRCP